MSTRVCHNIIYYSKSQFLLLWRVGVSKEQVPEIQTYYNKVEGAIHGGVNLLGIPVAVVSLMRMKAYRYMAGA